MLTPEVTIVAREDDDCVSKLPGIFQRLEHAPDTLVNREHAAHLVANHVVIRPAAGSGGRPVADLPLQHGLTSERVLRIRRALNRLIGVQIFMPLSGRERAVDRLVREVEHKRFGVLPPDELDRVIREQVGYIARDLLRLTVEVEDRVNVYALPFETDP